MLERGPISAGGKLECEIVDRLKLDRTPAVYKRVHSTLEKLEDKGKAIIGRNGSVLREARLAPEVNTVLLNSGTDDDDDEAPRVEQEVEVKIENHEIQSESEMPVMNEGPLKEKDPIWARLSLALLALQTAASPDGRLTGSSAQIIVRELNVTLAEANKLNGILAKLGLRQTSGSKAATVHQINMTKKEVTQEDWESMKDSNREPEVVTETDTETPSIAVESAKETVSTDAIPVEAVKPRSVIEQLLDAAEVLENKNETLQVEKRVLEERIENQRKELKLKDKQFDEEGARVAKVVADLQVALTQANTKIEGLQRQIRELTTPTDDRVKDFLDRHLPVDPNTSS